MTKWPLRRHELFGPKSASGNWGAFGGDQDSRAAAAPPISVSSVWKKVRLRGHMFQAQQPDHRPVICFLVGVNGICVRTIGF